MNRQKIRDLMLGIIGEDEPTIPGFADGADIGELEAEAIRNALRTELRLKVEAQLKEPPDFAHIDPEGWSETQFEVEGKG